MWVGDYRRWLYSILYVLLTCVRPLTTTMCTPEESGMKVHEITGTYGQSLTLNAETKKHVVLAVWKRFIVDPNTGETRPQQLVFHVGGNLTWSDPDHAQRYLALYNKDEQQVSFRLELQKMNCAERGEFECKFTTIGGDCNVRLNVTMVADPSPPSLANSTVRADAGEMVTVLCEANVGYPAGDIWWYYVPNDGSPTRRLQADPPVISSAGDCRFYAKSKLVTQVQKEDHMAKLRCVTKTFQQRNKEYAETTIYINGQAVVTPAPTPCANCTNPGGSVGDGEGGSSTLHLSSVLLWGVLLLSIARETFRSAS